MIDASKLPKGEPLGTFDEIHLAARCRDAERISTLLEAACDPNLRNHREPNGDGGNTPLWFAAQGSRSGGVPIAEKLLGAGARINERCEYGTTALHIATSWAQLEMVQFLIDNGADASSHDDDGKTPLQAALSDYERLQDKAKQGNLSQDCQSFLEKIPLVIEFLSTHECRTRTCRTTSIAGAQEVPEVWRSTKKPSSPYNMTEITQEAWSEVHQKACDIANASTMDDDVLVASHTAAMLDILDTLQRDFGRQPAIIATRADYVEGIESKRQLFAEALALARELGDKTEEAEILDSLHTLNHEL